MGLTPASDNPSAAHLRGRRYGALILAGLLSLLFLTTPSFSSLAWVHILGSFAVHACLFSLVAAVLTHAMHKPSVGMLAGGCIATQPALGATIAHGIPPLFALMTLLLILFHGIAHGGHRAKMKLLAARTAAAGIAAQIYPDFLPLILLFLAADMAQSPRARSWRHVALHAGLFILFAGSAFLIRGITDVFPSWTEFTGPPIPYTERLVTLPLQSMIAAMSQWVGWNPLLVFCAPIGLASLVIVSRPSGEDDLRRRQARACLPAVGMTALFYAPFIVACRGAPAPDMALRIFPFVAVAGVVGAYTVSRALGFLWDALLPALQTTPPIPPSRDDVASTRAGDYPAIRNALFILVLAANFYSLL